MRNNNKTRKIRKTRRKKFNKLRCSPLSKNRFSCYTKKNLLNLKDIWNKNKKHKKITSKMPNKIWKEFKTLLSDKCNDEQCWLEQPFMKNKINKELKNQIFAPKAPNSWKKNPVEWLDSMDITRVMRQYEFVYPNFKFIGPSPIDFDFRVETGECVWKELCGFDLKTLLKKGKDKIGIIFNMDPHYKDGSHWMSLFVNIPEKYLFYFDSNGEKTPQEIKNLASRIIEQASSLGINLKLYENSLEHQYQNTECGIYALYFTISLLENKYKPRYFLTHRISDNEMKKFRKIYFN